MLLFQQEVCLQRGYQKKNRWLHHVSMHFPCIFHAFSMDFPCIFHGLSADGHILLPMPSILSAVSGRGGGLRPPPSYSFPRLGPFFSMKHMVKYAIATVDGCEIHRNHHQKDAWNSINHGTHGINMDKTPFSTGDSDFATIHCMSDYGNSYVRYELLQWTRITDHKWNSSKKS